MVTGSYTEEVEDPCTIVVEIDRVTTPQTGTLDGPRVFTVEEILLRDLTITFRGVVWEGGRVTNTYVPLPRK